MTLSRNYYFLTSQFKRPCSFVPISVISLAKYLATIASFSVRVGVTSASVSASASVSDPLCSCRDACTCPGRNVISVLLAIIILVPILFLSSVEVL